MYSLTPPRTYRYRVYERSEKDWVIERTTSDPYQDMYNKYNNQIWDYVASVESKEAADKRVAELSKVVHYYYY